MTTILPRPADQTFRTHTDDARPGARRLTPRPTERPVPRWAEVVAHAIPLVLLPQCLWRLPFAFGFQMGLDVDKAMPALWISIPYVFTLSIVTEALALLSFGLVRGWGEVAPSWLPFMGGKRVNPYAAITTATVGALAVTAFWMPLALSWFGVVDDGAGFTGQGWNVLATICIAPGMLWGPLLLALTYGYWKRRCR